MKVCIILNGEVKDYIKTKEIILEENYDYIIGADGGCNHLFKMNIIPNYIVGDLDSIEREVIEYYENKNVIFKRYPSHKDETDSEICIYLAKSLGADEIDLLATLGGRIDHTLANIGLMNYIKENSIRPRILTSEEEIFMVKNETINLKGKKGDTISVISINGESKGVTLEKLEYPLDNAIVNHLSPLGISNVMLEDECIVSIEDGCALIIRNFNI